MAKKDDQLIYIGDNIGSLIKKDSLFIGGVPNHIKDLIDENPMINNLIVPIDELVDKKKKLKEKDSIEFLSNESLKEVK